MDENLSSEVGPQTSKKEKIRTYQNGKIVLNSDDFEALVDVFRTLLQWSNDLERTKKNATVVPST